MPSPFELSTLTEVIGTSGDRRIDAMFATKESLLAPFELRDTLEGATITKWGGSVGTAPDITFSFFSSDSIFSNEYPQQYIGSIGTLPIYLENTIRSAADIWSQYTNVKLSYVEETDINVGDIRIGVSQSNINFQSGAVAEAVVPIVGRIFSGDFYLSPQLVSIPASSFGDGTVNFTTIMHELGHSIFSLTDVSTVLGWNGASLSGDLNFRAYTIMSYNVVAGSTIEDGQQGIGLSYFPTTPMILDILAAQWLYGADTSTNAGNDTYTFNESDIYFETIWDGGGQDTFDASGATSNVKLDLRSGSLSDVGQDVFAGSEMMPDTLGIAYGVQIEDAIGGEGSDAIIGNTTNNFLSGQAGNDTISGGPGEDTLDGGHGIDIAIYSGPQASYTITHSMGSTIVEDQRADGDGTDTLIDIELIEFSDGDLNLAELPLEPDPSPPEPAPTTTVLDNGTSNINIDGATSGFTDFGGQDTYTVLNSFSGDVTIADNNPSIINLPQGLAITSALFLADGVQFTINGNTLTFLGDPASFEFKFGGTPLDPTAGTSQTFDQTADAFGTSIPSGGTGPNSATITGAVQADGSILSTPSLAQLIGVEDITLSPDYSYF